MTTDNLISNQRWMDERNTRSQNVYAVEKFGHSHPVPSSTTEDIWDGGGIYVPPTAARIHDVVSTSALDTDGGTGARRVTIYGLDENWRAVSEDVVMNGTTDVPTAITFTRVNRMIAFDSGNLDTNAGQITAVARVDGTTSSILDVGEGQTLMAVFTVPEGVTAHVGPIGASLNKAGGSTGSIIVRLLIRLDADSALGTWQTKWIGGLHSAGTSQAERITGYARQYPPRTDMKMQVADGTASGMVISAWMDILLVENSHRGSIGELEIPALRMS